jgi:DNA-binding LytR/AlgR family response regulator
VRYPYIVVDNSNDNIEETLHKLERFREFFCAGVALNSEQAIDLILEKQPEVVFLNIEPVNQKNDISLAIIGQLHQFLDKLPLFVVLSDSEKQAYECIKAGVFDYILKPVKTIDLVKCLLKVQKARKLPVNKQEKEPYTPAQSAERAEITESPEPSMRICIKSYGDYQFISLDDVMYLKADNNTTDFYLKSGRKLTAYKTLKHYEANLPENFYRIHNSYIVNSDYITRISTGKSLCFLNGNDISVSFSKTYKENIDILIRNISTEYL